MGVCIVGKELLSWRVTSLPVNRDQVICYCSAALIRDIAKDLSSPDLRYRSHSSRCRSDKRDSDKRDSDTPPPDYKHNKLDYFIVIKFYIFIFIDKTFHTHSFTFTFIL